MEISSTTKYQSRTHPELVFTIRKPTLAMRLAIFQAFKDSQNPLADLEALSLLWGAMIADVEGAEIDGRKAEPQEVLLHADEALLVDVAIHLRTLFENAPATTDEGDFEIIRLARTQIEEAEARIAARKQAGRIM